MAEQYDVSIKVVSVNGTCEQGHKVGDEWIIKEDKTPGGICIWAFCSIAPMACALAYGSSFPWSPDPDSAKAVCPDGDNPVEFELRRLQE